MNYRTLFRWAFTLAAMAAFVNATPGQAQQRGTISGTVREASTQRPVPGVQVFIPNTNMSTVTDAQGRYEFTGVLAGGTQVRVRAVGYSAALATTTVVGGQTVTVDFALNQSVIALDEVVVTGTGATVERKQLGNTIATVQAAMIEEAPVSNFSEALAAREAGVSILPSSGLAGEGARIRIRGNASLSQSNEPVVYVDGVRVDNGGGFINAGSGGGGAPSRLDDINPETIDRVEILKGAAAATLYGSEASAGVIQIFTKKGQQGRPRFSFRADQGVTKYPSDRLETNYGFARTQAQADRLNAIHQNTHIDANGTAGIQPFEVVGFPNVSPAAYYSTGVLGTYSASVSGGGADAVYNVSARYSRENGPYDVTQIVGPYFLGQYPGTVNVFPYEPGNIDLSRRTQGSANVTMFPKDRVTLSASIMFSDLHHQTPENNNNIYGVQSSLLNAKPENGNCAESLNRALGGSFGQDPNRPGYCYGPGNPWGNLAFSTPRENTFSEILQDSDHYNGTLKATYEPLQGRLRSDVTFGIDVTNTRDTEFYPFKYDVDNFSNNLDLGRKNHGSRFHREISADIRLTWTESFGNIESQFTGGGQGFITKNYERGGTGFDFPGPGLEIASAGAQRSTFEFFSSIVNLGLIGQEQIGFNDWAFLTVGGRWDRNSAFGESTSGKFYPKASASLVVSDMGSWNSTLLSTLRVRGALGRSGLQPGAFDKFRTYGPGTSQFGAGLVPANLGNQDLKPENTTEIEAGAELGLMSNRVGVDITYWSRNTKDALVEKQFAPTGGFRNRQLVNIGELEAKGWELKVNALVVDRPGFSVNVFANGAYLFQRIVDMGGAAPIKVGGSYPRYRNWLMEGQAPGVLLGAIILQPCGQTAYSLCLASGQYPYDTNGDGRPDTKAELEAYLSVPRGIDVFNTIRPRTGTVTGPLLDDNDADGDFLDNCMADVYSSVTKGKTKTMTDKNGNPYEYCLTKSTPDWSGAFGADISVARNFKINTLFEYKFGNFFVSNLTDGFRNSHPLIGRNNKRPAEIEAILLDPASTASQRADALIEWADYYKELTPYDGMNLAEKGDFLRWRELGVTYTPPSSFAQRLGLSNLAVNLSVRNAMLFTGYTGIDPEVNQVGRGGGSALDNNYLDSVDAWGFPLPRRWTASVRFGF
ncbi:MAG TPA: SusC/RagA family TonB-linked outer membrane protein [Gemmatimonadales bacterium]|nr:SusC/RagA family TonB-linked outer membrane protein [Gemmatimonadales bacterium]